MAQEDQKGLYVTTSAPPRVEQPIAARMESPHNNQMTAKSKRKRKQLRVAARLTVITDDQQETHGCSQRQQQRGHQAEQYRPQR